VCRSLTVRAQRQDDDALRNWSESLSAHRVRKRTTGEVVDVLDAELLEWGVNVILERDRGGNADEEEPVAS